MNLALLLALALPAASAPSVADRSVVVLNLEPKGVSKDAAELLTDNLVAFLRETGVFQRVVTAKELETTLAVEQQRQLLSCGTDSCMAELAGALNVQFVMSGTVGRLGDSFLLNIRLVNARTGVGSASISERAEGQESALLDRTRPAAEKLLQQAGLRPVSNPPDTLATPAPSRQPAATRDGSGPHALGMGLMAGGAASVAVAGLALVLGVGMVGAGLGTRLVAPGVPGSAGYVLLWVPAYLAALGLGAVVALGSPALVALGAALGVVGFTQR